MNRQDACSTRKFTLCGTGILPVLENGGRCEVNGNRSQLTLMATPAKTRFLQETGFLRQLPNFYRCRFHCRQSLAKPA